MPISIIRSVVRTAAQTAAKSDSFFWWIFRIEMNIHDTCFYQIWFLLFPITCHTWLSRLFPQKQPFQFSIYLVLFQFLACSSLHIKIYIYKFCRKISLLEKCFNTKYSSNIKIPTHQINYILRYFWVFRTLFSRIVAFYALAFSFGTLK